MKTRSTKPIGPTISGEHAPLSMGTHSMRQDLKGKQSPPPNFGAGRLGFTMPGR